MLVLPAFCPPHCRPPPQLAQAAHRCACLPPLCVLHPLHLTAADPPSSVCCLLLFIFDVRRLPPHPAQLPQRGPPPRCRTVGAGLFRLVPFHTSELLGWKGEPGAFGNGFLVLLQHGRRGVGCCTTQCQKLGAGQTTAVAAGLCLARCSSACPAPALCLAPTCCAAAFHQLPLLTSTHVPHSCLLFRRADPVPCEREDLQRGLRAQGHRPHQQRQGQGRP